MHKYSFSCSFYYMNKYFVTGLNLEVMCRKGVEHNKTHLSKMLDFLAADDLESLICDKKKGSNREIK